MTVEVTEVRNVVTVAPVTNAVTVAQSNNTVEVRGATLLGFHTIGGTDHDLTGALTIGGLFTPSGHIQMPVSGQIRDSGGTARVTFATTNPHVAIGPSTAGIAVGVRINDQVRIGGTPGVGVNNARLQVATWPQLGNGNSTLLQCNLSGTQTETSAFKKAAFDCVGTLDLAGFSLTNVLTGGFVAVRANLTAVDYVGGGVLSSAFNFSAGQSHGQGGGPVIITDNAYYFAEEFLDGSSGSNVITTHRAFWAKNQGDVANTVGTSVAMDIDAQSNGANTALSIRVQGAGVSIHQPSMTIGANVIPATSALIDMVSTTKAPIFPRMTTAQRDALTPVDGMIIVNTTAASFQKRIGAAWVNF